MPRTVIMQHVIHPTGEPDLRQCSQRTSLLATKHHSNCVTKLPKSQMRGAGAPPQPPQAGGDALADGCKPLTAPAVRRPAHPGDGWLTDYVCLRIVGRGGCSPSTPASGGDALADGCKPLTVPAGRRPAHPGDAVGWETLSAMFFGVAPSLHRSVQLSNVPNADDAETFWHPTRRESIAQRYAII